MIVSKYLKTSKPQNINLVIVRKQTFVSLHETTYIIYYYVTLPNMCSEFYLIDQLY
jgi:hypothetical protein